MDRIPAAVFEALAHLLLDRGARVDPHALVTAAHCGRLSLVERLLELGADPNTTDDFGDDSTLTRACQAPQHAEALVRLLLAHGADPNAGGKSPLMAALARKDERLVRLLLEHGARVDAVDAKRRSVMWWAEFSKRPALIALIRERLGK